MTLHGVAVGGSATLCAFSCCNSRYRPASGSGLVLAGGRAGTSTLRVGVTCLHGDAMSVAGINDEHHPARRL